MATPFLAKSAGFNCLGYVPDSQPFRTRLLTVAGPWPIFTAFQFHPWQFNCRSRV